jgi:transcriptional regulator with XRE-family HTH domain
MPIMLRNPVAKKRPKSAFGARLKARREAAGISQAELARQSGVHAVTISRLESGLLDPALSTIEALAAALGISAASLVSDQGEE